MAFANALPANNGVLPVVKRFEESAPTFVVGRARVTETDRGVARMDDGCGSAADINADPA